ncbi:MAG: AsmA family protein [Alphaproteobacteria bacterium]|nr:AsmA family protein [Alphaproteobacteria bacterium]
MKKILKKLAILAIVLVLLLGGGLYALATFAPMDYIEEKARTVVKEKTGRDLTIGSTRVVFWPHIGVTLKDVAFSSADWAEEKNMLRLSEVDVHVALRPLFEKRLEIVRFVLNQPEINLEVSPSGARNWEFAADVRKADQAPESKKASDASVADAMASFRLNEFEIRKGRVLYNDRQKKSKTLAEDVNITVSFPDIDSAFQLDGSLTYLGKRVQLVMGIDTPKDFIDGKSSGGNLVLNTDVIKANVAGRFMTSGSFISAAKVTAEIPSLSALIAWVTAKPAENLPFEKVSFNSVNTTVSADSIVLDGVSLTLDEVATSGAGAFSVGFSGTRPKIYARLDLHKISLDRFLGDAAQEQGGAAKKSAVPQNDWDATPIDFSGLRTVDADVQVHTGGFSIRGVEVGKSTLRAVLQDGKLEASSSEASLFGGLFSSDISLTSLPSGGAEQKLKFNMKDVQAQPVLEKFADFKKLSGAADANVDVTARGISQKEIISNLAGNGVVTFKNGSLTGIDFVNIAQMIQRGLQDAGVGEGKTDFVDLGGTFTIAQGIVTNNDFRMRGPLVQAGGSGTVDLPRKYVKYRVTPVLTASSATENARGVGVPVDIAGPFSNIRVKPDFKTVIQNAITDPSAIKEQGKALEQNLKGIKDDLKKDPGAAIQNLLGGGGLFGGSKPAPAPAPAPAPEGGAAP